jgi:hypothetical protein
MKRIVSFSAVIVEVLFILNTLVILVPNSLAYTNLIIADAGIGALLVSAIIFLLNPTSISTFVNPSRETSN